MALFSKREFAAMCGMKSGNLGNYIRRGKLVQRDDGLIDDDERINLDFLEHRKNYLKDKAAKGETPPGMKAEIKKATTTEKPPVQSVMTFDENGDPTNGDAGYTTLQRRKAKADLEKKLIDTKTATLNYQILKGKHIPADMVRDVIMELGRSILTNYKDSADSFLTEFGHRKALTATEHAEMKGVLVDQINTAHHKAIEAAKKQISAIVVDFKKENKELENASNPT